MTKKMMAFLSSLILAVSVLCGCSAPMVTPLNPSDYEDAPESERLDALPIYFAFNTGGGEYWDYEFSVEGVIESGSAPSQATSDDEDDDTIPAPLQAPGGNAFWFRGVAPGDVVITFTTTNESDEIVDIQQYAVRVYDDLRVSLLQEQFDSFR